MIAPEEEQDDADLFDIGRVDACSGMAGWTGLEPATSDVTGEDAFRRAEMTRVVHRGRDGPASLGGRLMGGEPSLQPAPVQVS